MILTFPDDGATIVDALSKLNPDALLCEPRHLFDRALVGITCQPVDDWPRGSDSPFVAVYCVELATQSLFEAGHDDATPKGESEGERFLRCAEHIEFNSVGAWMGVNTPCWVRSPESLVD